MHSSNPQLESSARILSWGPRLELAPVVRSWGSTRLTGTDILTAQTFRCELPSMAEAMEGEEQ
jgi:hypothetical protein